MKKILETQRISLSSPSLWDDRNDAFALELFRERVGAKSVLATCFTQAPETYHHWKVYAPDGACIEFDKQDFLESFPIGKDLKHREVSYREIKSVTETAPLIDELPFLKRYPYRDECEFRIVYADRAKEIGFREFGISLSSIRRITLSPWLSEERKEATKRTLKSIDGCKKLKVYRTTVLENPVWKAALKRCKQ